MSLFNTQEIAFGLDISDRNLRLVQLQKKRKQISVQFYNEEKLPLGCIVDGEIIKPEIFTKSLKKLVKTKHGHGQLSEEVVSVLPETKTFLKLINTSIGEEESVEAKIKKIMPKHVPLDIEGAYLDWQIISEDQNDKTILIGACSKNIVNSQVELLSNLNLMPIALEVEAAAISRALIDPSPNSDLDDQLPAQMIIDIGANRTGLFVYAMGAIQFTISLPISGDKITKKIAETLELDNANAEKAKIVCGLDSQKCHGALLEIFSDTIDGLAKHIKKAISFYESNVADAKSIEKIILCGGGANFINITTVLQEKLKIPTILSDPWQYIKNPDEDYFTPQKSQSFVTALGLALRGLNPKAFV